MPSLPKILETLTPLIAVPGVVFTLAITRLLVLPPHARWEDYFAFIVLFATLAGSSIALLWPRWTISNLLRAISIGVSLLLAVFFIYLYEDLYRSPPTLENHWRHYKEFWVFYILAYFFTGHCLGQIGKLVCKRP